MLKVPSPILSIRENFGEIGRDLKRVLTLMLTGDLGDRSTLAPPSNTLVGVAHTLSGLAVLASCDTTPEAMSLLPGVRLDMARLPGTGD